MLVKIDKLSLFIVLLSYCFVGYAYAETGNVLLIDDFENPSPSINAGWEVFGGGATAIKATPRTVADSSVIIRRAGARSLQLNGMAKDCYVGGVRRQVSFGHSSFSHLRMLLFGQASTRTKLTIVISGTAKGSEDIDHRGNPILDDVYTYSIYVTWAGWKQIAVPLTKFRDKRNRRLDINNKSVRWLEFVLLNDSKSGPVSVGIDNIELIVLKKDRR